ncbi:glycosyltransferase family 9 protein [Roseateles sp.]|uniref:glycosyltransferase family 9 protein n=1 Tax=Roseateles sp. TaxID=1971397 RepID=UPI0031E02C33
MTGAQALKAQEERWRRWQAARRVLLIRLDNLGDVLMTTPALAAVRESLPDAHLSLLAAPAMVGLKPHLPMVDEIIGFHAPWMKAGAMALPSGNAPTTSEAVEDGGADSACGVAPLGEHERQLLSRLLGERPADRFDAAIIFTVCTQSPLPAATLCRLAGIPLVLAHARERAYALLSDEVPDPDVVRAGMRHEVRRQLDLAARVGCVTHDERLRFHLRDADRRAAARALAAAGLSAGRPFVLVHPGASAPSRRYPADKLGEAAERIRRQDPTGRTGVVLCGGAGEEELIAQMRAAMGGTGLVLEPASGVGELAALIASAELLVGNNSGPAHLAAAVGTPVVDLYALTNPQHTPWRVESRVLSHDVPCRNCQKSVCPQGHHDCLRRITPAEVAAAAWDLLRAGRARAASAREGRGARLAETEAEAAAEAEAETTVDWGAAA